MITLKPRILNRRRIAKALHVWHTSTRPRSVKRAAQRWFRYTRHSALVEANERELQEA